MIELCLEIYSGKQDKNIKNKKIFFSVYISFYSSVCLFCTAASRARLTMVNTMSKMRGQVKSPGYPQAEGLLGECMLKYGRDMGEDTNFGERSVFVFYEQL